LAGKNKQLSTFDQSNPHPYLFYFLPDNAKIGGTEKAGLKRLMEYGSRGKRLFLFSSQPDIKTTFFFLSQLVTVLSGQRLWIRSGCNWLP